MAAVEHLGDVVDALGARGGVAGGGAQVDVAQAGGDLVHGDAGLEQMRSPVRTQRVRMREALGHSSRQARAAHEPVHRHGGEGERLLIAVAAETHEQRLLVEKPDPAGERVDRGPGLERLLHGLGDWHLALATALAAHV